MDSNPVESMRIVLQPNSRSLTAVDDVANATTGFEILIRREISEVVLRGFAGETTTAMERRAK